MDLPRLSEIDQILTESLLPRVLPAGWKLIKRNTFVHIHEHIGVIMTAQTERDGKRWLHVSVSHRDRMPTWPELHVIKNWLIGPDKVAVQVLPRETEYVNLHPYVLHLWHCLDGDPVPDFRWMGQI